MRKSRKAIFTCAVTGAIHTPCMSPYLGDARLLRIAQPADRLDTAELHWLVADMFDTMEAAHLADPLHRLRPEGAVDRTRRATSAVVSTPPTHC